MAAQEKYKSQAENVVRRQSGKGVDEEANDSDDFEKVEEKPKKMTRIKTVEAPTGAIFERNIPKVPEENTELGSSLQVNKSETEEPGETEKVAPAEEQAKAQEPETKAQPTMTEAEKTQKEKQQAKKQKRKEEANKPITANELQDLLKREEPKPKTPEDSDKSEEEKKEEEKKPEPPKIVRKGPKPRGMKKFKPVPQEEVEIAEHEMSANQKRKYEEKKAKQEAEEKARKEEAERKRLEQERIEKEERARKAKMIFEGMAAANKTQPQKQSSSNFMEIMNEQAVDSKQKAEEEARFKKMNQNKKKGLQFDYLSSDQKMVNMESMAASAQKPEFATKPTSAKGKKKTK